MLSGLPRWLSDKEPTCQCRDAEDLGLIPGLGRYPRLGNGKPLQYPYWKNPMDRGAWWATVHRVTVRHDLMTEHAYTYTVISKNGAIAQSHKIKKLRGNDKALRNLCNSAWIGSKLISSQKSSDRENYDSDVLNSPCQNSKKNRRKIRKVLLFIVSPYRHL